MARTWSSSLTTHLVSISRMYGALLPSLHTSEEIRTLARDKVSAELFSEGKADRFNTAVTDVPGICVTSCCILYRRLALALCSYSVYYDGYCEAGDSGQRVDVISHMWQCYSGLFVWRSRVISSFVVLQTRITLLLPSVKCYWRVRITSVLWYSPVVINYTRAWVESLVDHSLCWREVYQG